MSLSRFQIIVWTLIVVSAFFTLASARIQAGADDPLAIGIDQELWALLGISSASLAGTPLILRVKNNNILKGKQKETQKAEADADAAEKMFAKAQEAANTSVQQAQNAMASIEDVGQRANKKDLTAAMQMTAATSHAQTSSKVSQIAAERLVELKEEAKTKREDASAKKQAENQPSPLMKTGVAEFADMFKRDEGNRDHVDMSKVQMFFFTIIAALSYAVLLFNTLDISATQMEATHAVCDETLPEDTATGALKRLPCELPAVSPGLVALLGISHSAYLATKSIPSSKTPNGQ